MARVIRHINPEFKPLKQRIVQLVNDEYYPTTDYKPSYCFIKELEYYENTKCDVCEEFVPMKYRYLDRNGELIEALMCVLCRECICKELDTKRDEYEDCCSQHTRCVCDECACGMSVDFCMCVCECEIEAHKCEECPLHR